MSSGTALSDLVTKARTSVSTCILIKSDFLLKPAGLSIGFEVDSDILKVDGYGS